jgi:HlyD family secretion protein
VSGVIWVKRIVMALVVAAIVGGAVYALMPKAVGVDVALVDRGPIEVTVDEEGVARIRDVYRISAPVAGQLQRFPLEVGDPVEAGVTVVADIRPSAPAFLDERSRRELEAAASAAEAAVDLAVAEVSRAEAQLRLAEGDLARAERLSTSGTISARAMDKAVSDAETSRAQLKQAQASLELRHSELASAEARLIQPGQSGDAEAGGCCIQLRAPVDGAVLAVHAESAQVVPAGALIAELGDPDDLEIVVDVLSTDAVRIVPGAEARIEGWGGAEALPARVRTVEPSAFTKISALGIEEQRVNVVLDPVDSGAGWERLGHAFRVYARIRVWRGENVVRVPLAALFRRGEEWAVFRVVDGEAVLTPVAIDHRDERLAEVSDGLSEEDVVIVHPGDQVEDGVSVEVRP